MQKHTPAAGYPIVRKWGYGTCCYTSPTTFSNNSHSKVSFTFKFLFSFVTGKKAKILSALLLSQLHHFHHVDH